MANQRQGNVIIDFKSNVKGKSKKATAKGKVKSNVKGKSKKAKAKGKVKKTLESRSGTTWATMRKRMQHEIEMLQQKSVPVATSCSSTQTEEQPAEPSTVLQALNTISKLDERDITVVIGRLQCMMA